MSRTKGNPGGPGEQKGILGRLRSAGLVARKSLGQHFLHDPRILSSLVDLAGVGSGSKVLEVGTGPGTLTRELAARSSRVLTVEIDAGMAEFAAVELGNFDNVEMLQLDALDGKKKLHPLLLEKLNLLGNFFWVSNLPYGISTTLIIAVLESALPLQKAVLTVQNEVAERICAAVVVPGQGRRNRSKSQSSIGYGPATLLVGYWARSKYLKKIAPGAFWPPPRVESAVIRLEPRYEVITDQIKKDYDSFSEWVRLLFQQRRKQLGGTLRNILGQEGADKALTLGELDATLRPENLSCEDFQFLARVFPFDIS